MTTIKVNITPLSSFATYPKGDMIFGHFAYQTFLNGQEELKNYLNEEPKIIFSDFLPDGYLYKPSLPLKCFEVDDSDKKDFRKKEWISIDNLQNGKLDSCEDIKFYKTEIQVRNTLNRLTFTTDDSGQFAPYALQEISFTHQPVIYVSYNKDKFNEKEIVERLNRIGKIGFGKKSSIGKGLFKAEIDNNFNGFKTVESDYVLTISPTFLHNQKNKIDTAYYNLFNRFGKYHDSSTPFKKPILMADSGAVLKLKKFLSHIGRAVNNGIDDNKPSFVQGYSITVPFKLNDECLGDKR